MGTYELDENNEVRYVSRLSHEIRTTLTAISGYSDILTDKLKNHEDELVLESVISISEAKEHLLALVGDVLDLSKIKAKKIVTKIKPENIREQVTKVLQQQKLQAWKKNLDLKVTYSAEVPLSFNTDALLFRQILLNLVSNAVKYTDEGVVSLHVGYEAHSNYIKFIVSDTGRGISPEDQNKIFSAYEQSQSGSQASLAGGTGLGLDIAKSLSKVLGGQLSLVWSQVGVGTSFNLQLPLAQADRRLSRPVIETGCLGYVDVIDKKLRILVVDDMKENRFLFRYYMTETAFEIEEAESESQTIDLCSSKAFDFIFMDMQLEGTTGLKLMKRLVEGGSVDRTAFVAFTASTSISDRNYCLKSGFSGFVAKPFNREQLLHSIDSVLRGQIKSPSEGAKL